jgi:hypothetical protein
MKRFCYFSSFNAVGKCSKTSNFFSITFSPVFSMDSKSASNSAFFDTHMELLWTNLLGPHALFANFEAKHARSGSKIQKRLL